VANAGIPQKLDPALTAVLEKLSGEDREVVEGALKKAEKTEAELRYLADHDSLTGLLNRRRFRAELDQYVSFTARYGGQGAVMIIDIDGLKQVNDKLGHQVGDSLIRRISAALRERVRATDIVARLSGDEFAVLMPQSDTAGAMQLGEDLRAAVAEGSLSAAEQGSSTISVGITMFGGMRDAGAEAVLVAADQAMYRAKEEGRDRVALFEDPGANQVQAQRTRAGAVDDLAAGAVGDQLGGRRGLRRVRDEGPEGAAAEDRQQRRQQGQHRERGAGDADRRDRAQSGGAVDLGDHQAEQGGDNGQSRGEDRGTGRFERGAHRLVLVGGAVQLLAIAGDQQQRVVGSRAQHEDRHDRAGLAVDRHAQLGDAVADRA
jgi:diguanylate cyclase (GGDEF)-like protein